LGYYSSKFCTLFPTCRLSYKSTLLFTKRSQSIFFLCLYLRLAVGYVSISSMFLFI
jgi:hypothetical protein